ncbi:MAG: hypothetical protein H6907_15090 [Hyphomicrobiales bacterium]|nr:hypothetical protein [Hyphomicrobiales bacterium]
MAPTEMRAEPTLRMVLADGVGLLARHGLALARAGVLPALVLVALTPAAAVAAAGWPWGVALAADLASTVVGWAVLGLFQAACFRAYLHGDRPGWLAMICGGGGEGRLVTTFVALCLVSMAPSLVVVAGWLLLSRSHNTVVLLALLVPAGVLGITLFFRLVLALPAALEEAGDGTTLAGRLVAAWHRGRGRTGRLFLACLLINLPLIAVVTALQFAIHGIPGLAPTEALSDLMNAPVAVVSAALIAAMVAAVHARAGAAAPPAD